MPSRPASLMFDRHRFNPFEWLIVAAVIGVIVAVGMGYYQHLAERAVVLNMQMNTRNFATAVQVVQVYSRLLPADERRVLLPVPVSSKQAGVPIWVNAEGWPVDAGTDTAQPASLSACKRLWQTLLGVEKSAKLGDIGREALVIETFETTRCRYIRKGFSAQSYVFEYDSLTGRAVFIEH